MMLKMVCMEINQNAAEIHIQGHIKNQNIYLLLILKCEIFHALRKLIEH